MEEGANKNSSLRNRKNQSNNSGNKQTLHKPNDEKINKKKINKKINTKNVTKETKRKTPTSTYYITGWLFGRYMAIIYIIAFISAWVQLEGLIGSQGISPIDQYFTRITSSLLSESNFINHPTIFWLDQSDLMIHAVCLTGLLSGIALFLDMVPGITSSLCWFCYLSICVAGQNFFMYQWDLLLLESGFLFMFFHSFHLNLKPFSQNPRDFHAPDSIFWLFRLLLFRIHFVRGIQELFARDRIWRSLSIFQFHFQTQQSPTWIAWYFHQLPAIFHQAMAFWVLTVEIGVIFLLFGPQLLRRTACLYLVLLQIFYILTGNFGTFHWNVIGLCLLLLDDALFPNTIRSLTNIRRQNITKNGRKVKSSQPRLWHKRLTMFIAVGVIILTVVPLSTISKNQITAPKPLLDIYQKLYPWKIINHYGTFNKIPKERIEIIIQGSLDAHEWVEYEYLYKPGTNKNHLPTFVSPHISRLEYLLWVAAQSDYQQEVWISRLLHRLLEDSPSVVSLFRKEPFDYVPEYIRAVRYKSKFTSLTPASGNDSSVELRTDAKSWWETEYYDIYTPSFSQTINSMSSRRKNLRARKQQKVSRK